MRDEKEFCIRYGKPTPYNINTPITLRRYYVEGSGQLCPLCYQELYRVAGSLEIVYICNIGAQPDSTDYSQSAIDLGSFQQ